MSSKQPQTPMDSSMRLSAFIALLLASGCQDNSRTASASLPPMPSRLPTAEPAAIRASDQWLGHWNGPEGTSLHLSPKGENYVVAFQSLDGPTTYAGKSVGDHIEFVRDGSTESIRASNGKATGMKWLLEKNDCLTIRKGEGFCRD